MSTNDGGRAFPGEKSVRFGQDNGCNEGMSLRDYFAAKALGGLLSDTTTMANISKDSRRLNVNPIIYLASAAYDYADAMLKARGESKESGDEG